MDELIAEKMAKDPRLHEAKRLLLEAASDYSKKISTVKPADPERKIAYDQLLERFKEARGGKLWYPYIGSGIGNGPLVELLDGSVKYDFITGIGTHYWGHSHQDLISTSFDAACSDTIMQGNLMQNRDSLDLMELLLKNSGLDHCILSTSGVIANENAIKIAFQNRHPAYRILAFEHCFAGRTWSFSQITDKPAYRIGLPNNIFVDYIPFYDPEDPEGSTQRTIQVLKEHLKRYPQQHAAMIAELVQGEGGFYPGSTEFFTAIMKILKEHKIAIFVDEIQTFGRTEKLFAFQHFKLEEFVDIVSLGKLSQVCATLFRKDFNPKPGLLSQTFTGSIASIRASYKIIDSLLHGGYYGPEGKIAKIHRFFVERLKEIEDRNPGFIKGPFGIGGMIAFTPFNGEYEGSFKLTHDLFDEGVITFIAGSNPTRVRFLPPIGAINFEQITEVCKILESVLKKNRAAHG